MNKKIVLAALGLFNAFAWAAESDELDSDLHGFCIVEKSCSTKEFFSGLSIDLRTIAQPDTPEKDFQSDTDSEDFCLVEKDDLRISQPDTEEDCQNSANKARIHFNNKITVLDFQDIILDEKKNITLASFFFGHTVECHTQDEIEACRKAFFKENKLTFDSGCFLETLQRRGQDSFTATNIRLYNKDYNA